MILVLTPETLANPGILDVKTIPKRQLSLGVNAYPRGWLTSALFWRTVFEKAVVRYSILLSPFVLVMLIRPEWALGISQAPLLMIGIVLIVETYVLSVPSPEKRRALMPESDGDRVLDLLAARGRTALGAIGAARGWTDGALHLMIEQSEMLRLPKLTYISVQREGSDKGYVSLNAEERETLIKTIFDDALTEDMLQRTSLARNDVLRMVSLEMHRISAHARLAALARTTPVD